MTALRILVIDDDPDMRTLLASMLTHLGAFAHTVGDADRLDAALSETWDLALLDLVMPGTAFDACVATLSAHRFPAPVCLLSGNNAPTLERARVGLEAAGLKTTPPLIKPARIAALGELLRSVGEHSRDEPG